MHESARRKEAVRLWRERNPELQMMYDQRRRALKQSADSLPFTKDELSARMAYFGGKCWICHEHIEDGELHYDHKKPLSKGGSHMLANLAPAHALCNLVKSNMWWGIDDLDPMLQHIRARAQELQSEE